MSSAKQKLSFGFHDEDSHMRMKKVIGIPTDEADMRRIRDNNIIVAKFLLFRHAWKILRQLYMAATAKKMLMTMGALGTSKSLARFLVLLRNRTELTKKAIFFKYICESKHLKRCWNNFYRKIYSYKREITINSIINKMVERHYFRNKCSKFLRIQKTRCFFKRVVVSATVHSTLRRLRKAMLNLKAHAWCHSMSLKGDRVGGSCQLNAAKILRDNHTLRNSFLSWKATAHHGRLTACIEMNSDYHFCRQQLTRGIQNFSIWTDRAQSLRNQIETYHRTVKRNLLLRRALHRMRSRVDNYCFRSDEKDYSAHKHLRNIALRALHTWSSSHLNRSQEYDRLSMSCCHIRSRSKKRALSLWLDRRHEVSLFHDLATFAADYLRKRALIKHFIKWRKIRDFRTIVTIVSEPQGPAFGVIITEAAYQKHLRNLEDREDSEQLRTLSRHNMVLFKYWSIFCSALRVRKCFAIKLTAARDFRIRSILKVSFRAFLVIHHEHLSVLHNADRHMIHRSQRKVFEQLRWLTCTAYDNRERRNRLAMRFSEQKLRRAFHCLLALTAVAVRRPRMESAGILDPWLSDTQRVLLTDVRIEHEESSGTGAVWPSMAAGDGVIRLGAKSTSHWISNQKYWICTESRTVHMLKMALFALRRHKNIGRSYSAVRSVRLKRYTSILLRLWGDRKAAKRLLNACYHGVTANTLRYYFSQWVMDEKVESLLLKLSKKKENETVLQHLRLWSAYVLKTRMNRIVFRPQFGEYEGKVLLKKHLSSFITQLRKWGPVSRRAGASLTVGTRELMRKILRKWRLLTQCPIRKSESEGEGGSRFRNNSKGSGSGSVGARKLKKSWETAAARRVREVLVAQCRGRCLQYWAINCFLKYTEKRFQQCQSDRELDIYYNERLSRGVLTVLRCALRARHKSKKRRALYEKTSRESALSRAMAHIDSYCVFKWVHTQKMRVAVLQSRTTILRRGFRKILLCARRKRSFLS